MNAGHLALQQGEDPTPYLGAMARMTGPGGLIPEQVWDSKPIPERNLYPGKPSGSAMPLLWAHAEFLKLLVAQREGAATRAFEACPGTLRGPSSRSSSLALARPSPF